jgi:hypothetical protein
LGLRVHKSGVQVFGVALENAAKALTAHQLLDLKREKSELVVKVGTRADAVSDIGYRLGRVAKKLMKATREKIDKS